MIYAPSPLAIGVFVTFILIVIGLSAWLGRRATSAAGYYAAHGADPLVRQRHRLRRRLPLRGVVPRHLRDDRLLRLRRLPLFDRLPRRLDRRALRRRRAAQADGQLHLRRRPRQPLPLARHQAGGRHQHAGRQPLLPDSADGRRRRADHAAARPPARRRRAAGRRRRHHHRRHRRHGVDDLGAVHQGLAAGAVLLRADDPDPAPRAGRQRRRGRIAVRGSAGGRDPGAARHRGAAEGRRLGRQAVHAAAGSRVRAASRCGARRPATASPGSPRRSASP